jgi:hypothetical protein
MLREGLVTARAEPVPVRRPLVPARVLDVVAGNSLLLVLLALLATVLLAVAPQLLVADSWMTFVAGREIAQHGLPSHETLTVIAQGHRWTDQQWLAQIVFYGAERLGGMQLAVLLDVALVTATFALGIVVARRRGASARSTLIVAVFAVLVAPWSWQLRAQALALPLFVAVLTLAAAEVRSPSRRTLLALPLVALWANLHGSVLVGAGVVSLAGLAGLAARLRRAGGAPGLPRALVLTVAPWACLIASPYGVHLVGYYRLMLFDSPVSKVISEWQAPKPHGWYLVFFLFAAATVVLAAWQRRRLGWYGLAILAVTFAGSLRSGRGIVWFTLAALVLMPAALDGALGDRDPPLRRRLGVALGGTFAAILVVTLAVVAARPLSWFESEWPEAVPAAVARAAAEVDGPKAVFPSDMHGDWLLWKAPELRGRIAYDVRFELLTGSQLSSLVLYKSGRPGWQRAADGYRILVFDRSEGKRRPAAIEAEPGTRVLARSSTALVLLRAPA